jgi:AraC-like DNA-binding protein
VVLRNVFKGRAQSTHLGHKTSIKRIIGGSRAGTAPGARRIVERLRADLARGRIETTAEPVERVAEAVGFGDAENMRRAFIRVYGQPPQSIRRAIRS